MSVVVNPDITIPKKPEMPAPTNYLNDGTGFWSWAATVDHKRLGVMYLTGVLTFFFIGGVFALLVRTKLLNPAASNLLTWLDRSGKYVQDAAGNWQFTGTGEGGYNQAFTLHGAIMVFLVIIPSVPAAFGNFVMPIMLGAKDVAFPRLNLMSFWLYVTGAVFFLGTLFLGGLDTGWTFYMPYSGNTLTGVVPATFGAFILGFSSILTGLNFIVTVHMMRPPGMGWFRMPLFIWAIYATAVIQVLATPVLGITLLLLIVERVGGIGIFDPKLGGDPVLFQHFFWFYSHPAVYIMILPAMGVVSELIAVYSRKRVFGYTFVAFSSVAIALLGFLVWGHHMFTSESTLGSVVFSAITFTVAIPSAIKVFNWLATLYKGDISLETPMLYGLGFIALFTIGGLTGIFLGALSTDVHLHHTYFVVAHFHYVMMGSALFAFVGAIFHWWPKMFGKMYLDWVGQIACILIFVGFNTTFLPQFVLGAQGMPRRYATYDKGPEIWVVWHTLSTIGSYIMAVGFFVAAGALIESLLSDRKATRNPWGGASLEWEAASPPVTHNFEGVPVARDPYGFDEYEYDERNKNWVRRADADAIAAANAHAH
jgi:cytochrome c oxidase subunit 1